MAETILDMELLDNGGDLLMETIPGGGSGGGEGTSNYNNLSNKPKINGVTLSGDKSAEDLGLLGDDALDDYQTKAITDEGGYFTDDTVEGALQELGAKIESLVDGDEVAY